MSDADPHSPTFDYSSLQQLLAGSDDRTIQQAIVNAPFEFRLESALLFLGIMVLLVVDESTGMIDRVALSNTELAQNTTDVSSIPFSDIRIPLDDADNIIAKAIRDAAPQDTTDWKYLFTPAMAADQARLNQASGGIAYSAVYPLVGVGAGAAIIFSYFQYIDNIGHQQHDFMQQYSQLAADQLSRA